MKLRKGNDQLAGVEAFLGVQSNNHAQIPISSVVIKSWIQELVRPRTPSEQVNLKADIEANGLSTPITLATVEGEEYCLVDGHGRLEVYRELEKLTIPYTVKNFESNDEIKAWVYRKQLGRRNLTKQDRAYLIGSLKESKATIARELEIGTTQVADARNYYKAVHWLVEKGCKSREELLKLPISGVISLYKKMSEEITCTESVQPTVKKPVNWKMDTELVARLKKYAKASGQKSVSVAVEDIVRKYLDEAGG